MTNDNNIDNLFRENLYHRDFEFDPKHWGGAEKLIEADEKKRKSWLGGKTILTIVGIGLLFSLALGYLIFNNSIDDKNLISEEIITPENKNQSQGTEAESKPIIESSGEELISMDEKAGKKTSYIIDNQQKTEFQKDEIIPAHSKTSTTPDEIVNNPAKSNVPNEKTKSGRGEIRSVMKNVDPIPVRKPDQSETGKIITENTSDPGQKKNELVNSDITMVESKTEKEESRISGNENIITGKGEIISEDTPAQSENKNDITVLEKEEKNQSVMAEDEPESEILLPSVITLNKESTVEVKVVTEAVPMEQETKKPLKDRLNWLRHLSIGISAGTNFSQGFINTGTSPSGISAEPIGGLRFAYQLNEQVDIESGLFYNYRSGLNSKIISLTSKDLSNNIAYYSTNTTLNLHYLDLPIHLTYKYGKHSFIVGMHYSHLLNTRAEIIDTKEENGNSTIEHTSKLWYRNDGRFSSFDLAGIFGYDYSITDRLKICGRFNYGLFDVTDDSSFGNSVRDKNMQLRIMMDYRFMKY